MCLRQRIWILAGRSSAPEPVHEGLLGFHDYQAPVDDAHAMSSPRGFMVNIGPVNDNYCTDWLARTCPTHSRNAAHSCSGTTKP